MEVMRFHIYTLQHRCEYLASSTCKQMWSNIKGSS